jgi:hypothetical protein
MHKILRRLAEIFLNISLLPRKHVQYFLIMIYIDIYNSNCIHFIFSPSSCVMQMWLFVRVCTMHNQGALYGWDNLFIFLSNVCAFNIWLREKIFLNRFQGWLSVSLSCSYSCQWHNFNSFYGEGGRKTNNERKTLSSSLSVRRQKKFFCLTTTSTRRKTFRSFLLFMVSPSNWWWGLSKARRRWTFGGGEINFNQWSKTENSGGWALITFRYHHDKRINI